MKKTLAEIEPKLGHLPFRSTKWWLAAMSLTGKKMTELLDEIGDEINDSSDPDKNESVDDIINRALSDES